MTNRKLKNKIKFRKKLLNFLLLFMKPTNCIMVYLSQDLDNYITLLQNRMYRKHCKQNYNNNYSYDYNYFYGNNYFYDKKTA